jgi:hypothetical protein
VTTIGDRMEVVTSAYLLDNDEKHFFLDMIGSAHQQLHCKKISLAFLVLTGLVPSNACV